MRNKNYYINLNDREYLDVLSSLMNKRNKLIQSGKYTDGIDEVIMKIKTAKANLQVDLILLLDEFDYPPVTIDDVYKEVLEQAENFKKYA